MAFRATVPSSRFSTLQADDLFLDLSVIEYPATAAELFARPGPLILEIGFGNGSFLEHLGSAHPEWNVLGAEVSTPSTTRAFKRLRRAALPNVRLFRGDARFVVRDLLADRSLDRLYVNFPDPWPRRRHRNRRLLDRTFFDLLSIKLIVGGVIELTTDHGEYFAFARESARASGGFQEEVCEPDTELLETRYARKWLRQDKPIFHAKFHNTVECAPSVSPSVQREPMQHAMMEGVLPQPEGFEREAHHTKNAHVVMVDVLRNLDGTGLVFTVLVEESGLKQEILVEALARTNGVYVGVRQFGRPLATRGVGDAVRVVAGWLEQRGLRLVDTWY